MALSHLSEQQRQVLLKLARRSIAHSLQHEGALKVDPANFRPPLSEPGACFVTLKINGQLRGCIGHLQAIQTLVEDVVDNARSAALLDRRFQPLTVAEFSHIHIHISILTPEQPLPVDDEADLLKKLRPGVDGLTIEYGSHRATFLPAVWEQLTEPAEFVNHLKQKAGLPRDFWAEEMKCAVYQSVAFGEETHA